MAEEIAAVRRDLNVKDRVFRKQQRDRIPDLRDGRENQQSVAVLGKAELARAAKHSLRFDAAQLARFDLEIADEHRAGPRERNFVTYFVIRRAADDLPCLAAAVINLANAQAIRVRVLLR